MNNNDFIGGIKMRMGVDLIGSAVGGPTGVGNPD